MPFNVIGIFISLLYEEFFQGISRYSFTFFLQQIHLKVRSLPSNNLGVLDVSEGG